ncbi:MAG: hypothetical protein JWO06_3748 [Bacteroidota bacterium]|nr:hypothetical protein [Bacteroidota bacterium]
MKKIVPIVFVFVLCSLKTSQSLKSWYHHSLNISEPSDICLSARDPSHYYIVSNRGCLAETDSTGKVIRKTQYDGSDYEAVCVKDNMIYALDESLRRLDIMTESDFKIKKSLFLNYSGSRNKGFEGLVYIPGQKKFVAVIEKPATIVEMNDQMQVTNQLQLKQFHELSSVTYYNNFLWLLSDEDHEVLKVNPDDYSILGRWKLPVINPEGICFDNDGNLLIVSDDMSELFKFKIPNP